MNLTQLHCFSVVAKLESITKASKVLYISQPAVSKMIKQLEKELDNKLFIRFGRTIKLNQIGREFQNYVNNSLNELHQGIEYVKNQESQNNQPISILIEVGSNFIAKIVTLIQHKFPNIYLKITQRTIQKIDENHFDLIITSFLPKNFFFVPLLKEEIFIGSKLNLNVHKSFIKTSNLKNITFIGLSKRNQLRQTIDDYLNKKNISLNYKYETDEPSTLRSLVNTGVGAGFIPSVTWQLSCKKLHLTKLYPFSPKQTLYLCSPNNALSNIQIKIGRELINIFARAKKMC